jgi:hypothetical protein
VFILSESLVVVVDSVEVFSGIVCCIGMFCGYHLLSLW